MLEFEFFVWVVLHEKLDHELLHMCSKQHALALLSCCTQALADGHVSVQEAHHMLHCSLESLVANLGSCALSLFFSDMFSKSVCMVKCQPRQPCAVGLRCAFGGFMGAHVLKQGSAGQTGQELGAMGGHVSKAELGT